jgi:hypothetical protein
MAVKPPEAKGLRGYRTYSSRTGQTNTIALEWEFDSLAEWEQFMPHFATAPVNAELFRKWDELVPGSSVCDVWDLLGSG